MSLLQKSTSRQNGALPVTIGPPAADSKAASAPTLSRGQTVYVPVYSHSYSGNRERPLDLTATISVRNTDPDEPITIHSVDYYDSEGNLLREHLDQPVILRKMSPVRYIVKQSDKAGGSGANFLIKWRADHQVNPRL